MEIIKLNNISKKTFQSIMDRDNSDIDLKTRSTVAKILTDVATKGDSAINYYETKFANNNQNKYLVTTKEKSQIKISSSDKKAITYAYNSIFNFSKLQKPKNVKFIDNNKSLSQKYIPIQNVGIYIPGGTAPLVSTSLMTIIPALIANCPRIVICTPCDKNKKINPAILYVAKLCKIKEIYKVGGAQAIALMAYGTQTIKKVNKIFGPGNKFVTEAKKQINSQVNGCTIDMPAGPSEVLIIADKSANYRFVASDLLAQLEHDVSAKAILITTDVSFANNVFAEVKKQALTLTRRAIITTSLKNSYILIAKDINEAIQFSNEFAPEHLMLQVINPDKYLNLITNAGSVFIGDYSSEALGDYVSGTNHVLPTSQNAKCYSGLSVSSYMKAVTFQEVTKQGIKDMERSLIQLSDIEGLDAHKKSVLIRTKSLKGKQQ
jgi:histidinol dehydrogenase